MEEILSHPIWGVIQAIFAIFAFVGMYHVARWKPRKSLSYGIDVVQLIGVSAQVASKVRVEYKDSPVNELYSVSVKIANTGKASIREQDYISPLELKVLAGRILDVGILRAEPPSLHRVLRLDGENGTITLGRISLLEGEWFEVQLLFDSIYRSKDGIQPIDIQARIDGLRRLDKQDYYSMTANTEVMRRASWIFLFVTSIASIGYVIYLVQSGINMNEMGVSESLLLGFIWGVTTTGYLGWMMGRMRANRWRKQNHIRIRMTDAAGEGVNKP